MTRALVVLSCWIPVVVGAQSTGSSFGGSAWGSTSSSSSSSSYSPSSSSFSSSSSYSSSSSSYSSSSSDDSSSSWGSTSDSSGSYSASSSSRTAFHVVTPEENRRKMKINFGIIGAAFVGILFILALQIPGRRRVAAQPPANMPDAFVPRPLTEMIDVSVLSIAIDWRARRRVQEQLAALRKEAATFRRGGQAQTRAELMRLLQHTARVVRDQRVAWLYAGGRDFPMAPMSVAQARFNEMVAEFKTRYRHEVREGEVAPELRAPRPEEGEGVVVVSLIVAARGDLLGLRSASDAHSVELHLNRLANAGLELQALEVVWSPAAEDDRMSTAELEVLYPEMKKLDEASQAGRIFCGHCNAPYAGELASCPACGAPRTAV